jgi:hypothetical protein
MKRDNEKVSLLALLVLGVMVAFVFVVKIGSQPSNSSGFSVVKDIFEKRVY